MYDTQTVQYDAEWLRGIQAGCPKAFTTLYGSVAPALRAFACRYVPTELAEDVVQDVMLDLWVRRDALVVRASLERYLFGAVRRRLADRQRYEARSRGVTDAMTRGSILPPPSALPTRSPAEAAEAAELERGVAEALAALPARARLVLTLRWVKGLSYAEIAGALGISAAAAKKQGQRAQPVVRRLLARFALP